MTEELHDKVHRLYKDVKLPIFTEQSPSWEANSNSASQETPHLLWNRVHKSPAIGPYPEPHESSPHFPTLFP
jgi:hypothetical protein